jgi:membrane protein
VFAHTRAHVWRTLVAARRRYREIRGATVAAALTLNAFSALFPALVCATAVVGFLARGHPDVARRVTDSLGLHGTAAQLVEDAVASAADAAPAASAVGLAGLAWAGLAVFRALDEAFNAAWGKPGRGLAARPLGLVWLAGAVVVLGASTATARIATRLPGPALPLTLVAGAAADAALFVWSARVFTTVVVPWRDRLPGAVAFAAGMSLLKPLATVALPRLIAASSGLYGSIGAVFATLAWLGLLARLVVFCAALNASLGEPGPGDG